MQCCIGTTKTPTNFHLSIVITMKIGSQLQFEIPDQCPDLCAFQKDLQFFDSTSMCFRCPVINCLGDSTNRLIDPWNYRDDWAKEWEIFFKGGPTPQLQLEN